MAYIGFLNVGLIELGAVPSLATLNQPVLWVFLIGMLLVVALHLLNVRGAMLIAIILATPIGIPFGVTKPDPEVTTSFVEACQALPTTFMAIFRKEGLVSLFTDMSKLPLVRITILAFSLSDTFDTIGTGRRTGIFFAEDEASIEAGKGFKTRLDKALFADATATSIGSLFGTFNTTTVVESAAGIGAGGRTGLTSVVTAIFLGLSPFLASFVSAVPDAATAPALVMVGIMMASSFKAVDWNDLDEAIPAFFGGFFTALCSSISYGIAAGFVFFCIVKVCRGKARDVHPILWVCTVLFVLNFILLALL